jgi:agmatinase/guanidinopropionase
MTNKALGGDLNPFGGIATYMKCEPTRNLENVDVAVVGVPFDSGTSGRSGSRLGPRSIRLASLNLWGFHPHHQIAPTEVLKVVDYGDVDVLPPNIDLTMDVIESTLTEILDSNVTPMILGGDHSIIVPNLRAHAKKFGALGVVHIDAHPDTWDTEFGDLKYSHGTGFRRACEEGLIDPERYIMVGIRGPVSDADSITDARRYATRVIDIDEAFEMGIPAIIGAIHEVVGEGPVYVSYDIDSCDPAYAPGTGTPEVGGFTSYQALQLVRGLRGLNLVGCDLVEVNPQYDHGEITAVLAANLSFELLTLLALQKLDAE